MEEFFSTFPPLSFPRVPPFFIFFFSVIARVMRVEELGGFTLTFSFFFSFFPFSPLRWIFIARGPVDAAELDRCFFSASSFSCLGGRQQRITSELGLLFFFCVGQLNIEKLKLESFLFLFALDFNHVSLSGMEEIPPQSFSFSPPSAELEKGNLSRFPCLSLVFYILRVGREE